MVLDKPLNLVWNSERLLQAAVLIAYLMADGFFVFAGWNPFGPFAKPLPYMVVPLVVLAAFWFGQLGATVSLAALAGIAVWGTVNGYGLFVHGSLNESLLSLQMFIGVLSVTALVLAGVLEERRQHEHARGLL